MEDKKWKPIGWFECPECRGELEGFTEAERIVNGDRQADYSDPVENFKHISAIASSISKENLSPTVCAIVMIAVKLAREDYKHKMDNLVDLAGYVEILHRIKESEVSL